MHRATGRLEFSGSIPSGSRSHAYGQQSIERFMSGQWHRPFNLDPRDLRHFRPPSDRSMIHPLTQHGAPQLSRVDAHLLTTSIPLRLLLVILRCGAHQVLVRNHILLSLGARKDIKYRFRIGKELLFGSHIDLIWAPFPLLFWQRSATICEPSARTGSFWVF